MGYYSPTEANLDDLSPGEITRLLRHVASGDKSAEDRLIPLVYCELQRIASRYMRREGVGHTLQTTALVHEAYLRIVRPGPAEWQSRAHFFAVAATVMRRILVDYARAREAEKRGGGAVDMGPEMLDGVAALGGDSEQVLALDAALDRLTALDGRQSRIVELRFFTGLTIDETADVLNVSPRTVKREWQLAKAWLYGELMS